MECGGYKKEFKWRPFDEKNNVPSKSTSKVKKGESTSKVAVVYVRVVD